MRKPIIDLVEKPVEFQDSFDQCSWDAYIAPRKTTLVCITWVGEDFVVPTKHWWVTEEEAKRVALHPDKTNTDYQYYPMTDEDLKSKLDYIYSLITYPLAHQKTVEDVRNYIQSYGA